MSSVEENFQDQYRELDNATLRQIAGGEVPWVEEGHFVWAARRAARGLLVERGAADIPHVAIWDLAGQPPLWLRWLTSSFLICVALTVIIATAAIAPGDVASDAEACAAVTATLHDTDFAYHHRLGVTDCVVARDSARKTEDEHHIPIRIRACIEITAPQLERLVREPNAAVMAALHRYGGEPRPGRYCSPGEIETADLVLRAGRPWYTRLRVGFR